MTCIHNKDEVAFFLKVEHAAFKLRAHFEKVETWAEEEETTPTATIVILEPWGFSNEDISEIARILHECGLKYTIDVITTEDKHDSIYMKMQMLVRDADAKKEAD